MKINPILSWSTAAALACLFSAGAGAQSLALSYKLGTATAPGSEKERSIVDRCAGLNWAASLAASCNIEASAPASSVRVAEAAPSSEASDSASAKRNLDENPPAAGETFSGFAPPILGSPASASRLLRAAPGKSPSEAGKDGDPLVRFGSTYRLRNGDDGRDATRFKDVTSENRTQSNGVKNVAVELLFPFQ